MLDKIAEVLVDFARKPPAAFAKLVAHVLMPGSLMILAVSGVYSPSSAFDFSGPIRIAELQTEIDTLGQVTQKKGIALTIEPVEAEYSIPLSAASSVWLSLDAEQARINDRHLSLTRSGLRGKSPLLGVSIPVTVVVTGEAKDEVWIPGGIDQLKNWQLEPRRSIAFLSNVLLVCVFVFGMSLATVLAPHGYGIEDAATETRTNPN